MRGAVRTLIVTDYGELVRQPLIRLAFGDPPSPEGEGFGAVQTYNAKR